MIWNVISTSNWRSRKRLDPNEKLELEWGEYHARGVHKKNSLRYAGAKKGNMWLRCHSDRYNVLSLITETTICLTIIITKPDFPMDRCQRITYKMKLQARKWINESLLASSRPGAYLRATTDARTFYPFTNPMRLLTVRGCTTIYIR